jgi:hypothetical protein
MYRRGVFDDVVAGGPLPGLRWAGDESARGALLAVQRARASVARVWSRASVRAAIIEWREEHGSAPTLADTREESWTGPLPAHAAPPLRRRGRGVARARPGA